MEVIVRNLQDEATETQVINFFRGVLNRLGIKIFHCQKLKSRGCATITILDTAKARQFLIIHGQTLPGKRGFGTVRQKLHHKTRQIYCSQSSKAPDEYLLKSLQKEETDRYLASQRQKPKIVPAKLDQQANSAPDQRAWDICQLRCGQWSYVGNDLAFSTYFDQTRKGRVLFAQQTLRINLNPYSADSPSHQIEMPYSSIESFTVGPKSNHSITLSLSEAPKFYEQLDQQSPGQTPSLDIQQMLQYMAIRPQPQQFRRKRITALSESHATVAPSCLCYRFLLSNPNDVAGVLALKKFPTIPASISWSTSVIKRPRSFEDEMNKLKSVLNSKAYDRLSFELKFQLQKLAQNGYLHPKMVERLLVIVYRRVSDTDSSTIVKAVRRLFIQIPYPGPETEASELSIDAISDLLDKAFESIAYEGSYFSGLNDRYDHIAPVHKATVTPAGIYLAGPEPEVRNRVLRKYSSFPSHFLSVAFLDEDWEPLRFDRQTSGNEIYHERYLRALKSGINIANRQYEFLGFSHSSLRSQTCWFMAPFVLDGSLIFAQSIIQGLGDFSLIRSPAKCAARIGQAFSQTLSSVSIVPEAFQVIPDVERNGRTFSDGVGTCSSAVLQEIQKKYTRGLRPTVLQIRFQGAKGVISLDTRLEGTALCLRPSMIKFEVPDNVANIEICGAAVKPLPMYLNRQLIKILEDLHVPANAFLDLQKTAIEKLRMTTESAINASSFLERSFIGKAARLPWLIRKLWAIRLSFTDDDFLRDTLELAVLIQLRELKYRSRIRVEKGVTLYGIMDETGYLQEGKVYCSIHTERGGEIITGNVVITRSPALHPGDVQCVTAVDVPADSPLCALHNVVVFSSHGQRDLPSQLSGGDLDGDLYNVIYDDTLYPKRLSEPADYITATPIDIGRPVERSDMTEFFVKFMENDNLGVIATLHQIVADRSDLGTFDPVCIGLAGLHSTAVDFSKTGIPVEFRLLPKYPKIRPDFLAPGPRVLIEKTINFEEEDLDPPLTDDNPELDEVSSYEAPKLRYYASPKVLGRLYREIDERGFIGQIQAQSSNLSKGIGMKYSLLDAVWVHVRDRVELIQWRHYIDFARDVKENYEENLVDTMHQYSSHPSHFLMETEVISGNMLGKNGAQSHRQREFSKTMKEKYERDTEYTVMSITRGEDGNSGEEALERSIACLYVACNTVRVRKKVGALVSFAWIAAAVCLKEVEKLPG